MGGLVAGARAAELGAEVMLIDKGGPLGDGNTLTTTGTFYTAGMHPSSSPDELYGSATRGGAAYPDLARTWADNCRRALEWLEHAGIQVDRSGDGPPHLESLGTLSTSPVCRIDTGPNIIKKLRTFFQANRGVITSKTRAVKLLTDKGRVVGVEAIDGSEGRVVFRSGATILATGGFQANRELLRKYVGRHADKCKLVGSSAATGDGLRMAMAAGAKAVNLQYMYARLLTTKALTDDRFWPYPTMDTLIEDGIVINKAGRRFTDEGWGDVPLANIVARWDDVTGAYLIFDSTAWERSKGDTQSLVAPNPWMIEKEGGVVKSESITELATKLGVNSKNLELTFDEFNSAAARRRLGELRVPRINHPSPLKSPFFAIRVVPAIVSTMGGPLVNRRMDVLSRKGKPIPGLYAAGDVVGGFMGGRNGGYTGGLAQAAVTGILAGESAQKLVSTVSPIPAR